MQCPAYAAFDSSHRLLSQDLKRNVDHGAVHYKRWQLAQQRLKAYLTQLANLSEKEYNSMKESDKEAFWINAYNAMTIKVVLDNYPIKGNDPHYPANSLRQIPDCWEGFKFVAAGRRCNLYEIEHEILRRDFHDHRTHFAVVCAAKGCARLLDHAYQGKTLNRELDEAEKRFLRDPNNVQFDFAAKAVTVSQLFKWFPLDFTPVAGLGKKFPPPSDDEIVLSYLIEKSAPEVKQRFTADPTLKSQFKVIYRPYDWSLNDAD